MRLAKTDMARAALQARDPAISVTERRVLILCDGQRGDADIVGLLGAAAAPAVARLLATGYLQWPDAAPRAAVAAPAVRDSRATPPRPASPAAAAGALAGSSSSTRRSLVAARMYLLDMLALQRGVDTGAQAATLREARTETATLDALVAALSLLHRVASPSYCERVDLRLREVLPIDQLDAWTAHACAARPPLTTAEPVGAAQLQPSL